MQALVQAAWWIPNHRKHFDPFLVRPQPRPTPHPPSQSIHCQSEPFPSQITFHKPGPARSRWGDQQTIAGPEKWWNENDSLYFARRWGRWRWTVVLMISPGQQPDSTNMSLFTFATQQPSNTNHIQRCLIKTYKSFYTQQCFRTSIDSKYLEWAMRTPGILPMHIT